MFCEGRTADMPDATVIGFRSHHPQRSPPYCSYALRNLISVRGAEREERPVRPRFVDSASNGRAGQEPRSVGANNGEGLADRMSPVGVEQRGRGGAIGEAEPVARGPLASAHGTVEPAIRGLEQ